MTQTTVNVGEVKLGKSQLQMPVKDPPMTIERNTAVLLLKKLADDNCKYFKQQGGGAFATRIAEACHEIFVSTDLVKELVGQLQDVSRICDYDENTPGNGFRSLICICDVVILRLISVLRDCSENRTTIMFRVSHYCKEIESFGAVLRFLILAFHQVILLMEIREDRSLFPPLDSEYEQFNGILRSIEALDPSCFYGRALGFQFFQSVTRIFRIIGIVLATYSLSWESRTSAIGSLLRSGKLLLNPEERAGRIIKVTREADIEFCRAFWNLSEISVPKLFCPTMALCECREIPLDGPMPLETVDGEIVFIPEPSAHTGKRPVSIRVISVSHRVGLSPSAVSHKLPLSSNLLIHCHGGGYVATSSKSHETYLRFWAKSLNCPLVSIDYSLAPENPFPRPTEEVLYAYAWILNNSTRLGWTGERVCMVGDSAGGNLIMSVNLRLVELNVKRMPDGIVPIYTPFLFQYLPSPSRVLSFMDPLLHMGVVIRCAAAYTGVVIPSDNEDCTNLERDKALSDESRNDQDCSSARGNGGGNNGGVVKPRKSLLEYVNQVQKAQRDHQLDFSHGSQSIVSLINLSQGKSFFQPAPPTLPPPVQNKALDGSSNVNSEGGEKHENDVIAQRPDVATGDTVTTSSVTDVPDEDADDDFGAAEESGGAQAVQVVGDPVHICLSSASVDQALIDYLQLHPITKRSMQPAVVSSTSDSEATPKEVDNHSSMEVSEIVVRDESKQAGANDDNAATFRAVQEAEVASVTASVVADVAASGDAEPTPSTAYASTLAGLSSFPRSLTTSFFTSYSSSAAAKSDASSASVNPTAAIEKQPIFAEKRKLARNKCRSLSQSLAGTAALAAGHAYDNISEWFDATSRATPVGHIDKQKLTRVSNMSARKAACVQLEDLAATSDGSSHQSHFTQLLKLKLPRNHLSSPMYAQPELLARLPPIRFVACHLDPLLDDTVMFARKVRDSGGRVVSLDIVDSLPHGFLNFAPMSADCYEGMTLCLQRIKEILQ